MENKVLNKGIPVSLSLNATLTGGYEAAPYDKKRIFFISFIAIFIAAMVSVIAKFLIYLIDLFTNIAFFGQFSLEPHSPATNSLGIFVIFIPAIGGIIVGLMALYGSKAIRGHGIPEAMEQVLVNQSKIKPSITYLKPLSAAISIGTGGPFGAEGPIIATGGALGSTIGQLLRISDNERKILLAAGATAGMSAIFGSPVAAIFLAIELLLFEFSPRSFVPVALACITGAAGHLLLFPSGPVFPLSAPIQMPGAEALFAYSVIGLVIGALSVVVTKAVYFIEDSFEKLPVHWAIWPALGGLVVGAVGYFSPRTLGVGYNNISDVLSGSMTVQLILSLCIFKFISWSVSLGSGTSGGTLAPLLTIGGATGALLGHLCITLFPTAGVVIPLAGLVGMAAMFAGASRAFLTSIVFALETTYQSNALLPLLATCSASYFVAFFLMKNSIMTEKIARRGVKTPDTYESDILERLTVAQYMNDHGIVFSENNSVKEVCDWLEHEKKPGSNYLIVAGDEGHFKGIVHRADLVEHANGSASVSDLVHHSRSYVTEAMSLRTAVHLMAAEAVDVLPVVSSEDQVISGLLSYHKIISAYRRDQDSREMRNKHLSLKTRRLAVLIRGRLKNLRD